MNIPCYPWNLVRNVYPKSAPAEQVETGRRDRASALMLCLPGRYLIAGAYSCKVGLHRAERPAGLGGFE